MNYIDTITNILSLLLDKEITKDSDISTDNCEIWDSMKHIEIITTLEEELDITFDINDIPKLTSLKAIIEKVSQIKG